MIGGAVNSINAHELKKLKDYNKNFTLLDVRENDELSIAKIDPHKHIPMGEIQNRKDELNKNSLIYAMVKTHNKNPQYILMNNQHLVY